MNLLSKLLFVSFFSFSIVSCQLQNGEPSVLVLDDNIFGNGQANYQRGARGNIDGGSAFKQNNDFFTEELKAIKVSDSLSEQEKNDLVFIREEEKLARDFYKAMFDKWKQRSFDNISKSEQFHMDAIKILIDRYKLDDPVGNNNNGIFKDSTLQELYNNLIKEGSISLENALKIGAKVEEIDIKDLKKSINNTKLDDLKLVYDSLMSASENHLRAFVSNFNKFSKTKYEQQILSKEEFESIVK